MRRTLAKYVIRRIKNKCQLLRKRAVAIAQRKSRELWTEVNKLKSSKSHSTNCMDDVTGSEQISKIFSDKYCELYNSVSYENLQLANIISDNTVDVKMYCMNEHNSTCTVNESITHTHSVTPDMVQSDITNKSGYFTVHPPPAPSGPKFSNSENCCGSENAMPPKLPANFMCLYVFHFAK